MLKTEEVEMNFYVLKEIIFIKVKIMRMVLYRKRNYWTHIE